MSRASNTPTPRVLFEALEPRLLLDGAGPGGGDEWPCVADPNHDGLVNVTDLAILAAGFGSAGGTTFEQGDLNRDDVISATDLAILDAHFGTECDCFDPTDWETGAPYADGTGTETDPFLIWTADQLVNVSLEANSGDWDSHFMLLQDLDLTGKPFEMIGRYDALPFTGTHSSPRRSE